MLPVVVDQHAPALAAHEERDGRFVELIVHPVLIGRAAQIQPRAVALAQSVKALRLVHAQREAERRVFGALGRFGRALTVLAGIADDNALSQLLVGIALEHSVQAVVPRLILRVRPDIQRQHAARGQRHGVLGDGEARVRAFLRLSVQDLVALQPGFLKVLAAANADNTLRYGFNSRLHDFFSLKYVGFRAFYIRSAGWISAGLPERQGI